MSKSHKPVSEQVIVITGASSGIGLTTALAAAKQGASLVLAARSTDTLNQIASHITADGGKAVAVTADVGNRADVEKIAETAIREFGRIDTWVNNAGVAIYGRLDEVPDEDSQRLFQTNVWGLIYGSLVALPYLRKSGGTLINLGSEVSDAVVPLQSMYSASKHAVKGFTDGLRLELESDNSPVSVTLIQPTAVDTPYPDHAGNYLTQEPKLPTPMIEPEKVASAILEAAESHKDSVKVGAGSVINTTMAKWFPAIGDEVSKMQIGRQQRDELPQHPRQGTLYEAGERVNGSGRTHGRGNENPANMQEARESNLRQETA